MKRILATTYKNYLTCMSKLGKHAGGHKTPGDEHTVADEVGRQGAFIDLDQEATMLGNAYRGIGVMVAFLSALIIFSAIAPVALDLHGRSYWILGITEVASMFIVVGLIFYAKKSHLHKRWRDTRRAAEGLRYAKLSGLLEDAENAPTPQNISRLKEEALSHLSGEWCQITYNLRKNASYHKIEKLSEKIGWFGFALALIGALWHLWSHENWLLLATVFLPALVGALHGLNSFLKLDDLIHDHKKMANQLEEIKKRIGGASDDPDSVIKASRMVYETLLDRDEQWAEMVERQKIQA